MKTYYLIDMSTRKHILSCSDYIEDLIKLYGDKKELLTKIEKNIVYVIDANITDNKLYYIFDFITKDVTKGDNDTFFNIRKHYPNFNDSIAKGDIFYCLGNRILYNEFLSLCSR